MHVFTNPCSFPCVPLDGTPPSPSSSYPSPGQHRRFQRVEILQIAEGSQLYSPEDVTVRQGKVLVAEPVLTPLGISFACDNIVLVAIS